SGINKARRATTPIIPTTQLFDIPEPFTKTLHDDDFLIVDKMITRRQRILLFASREQLKMLLGADTILMDGTFSTWPRVKINSYADAIMSDFEPALITVIAAEFVGATHSSCYFHFTQAVYRAIQRVGLSTSYNNDNDIKHSCRKLMALALLPEPIIEDTYDELLAAMSIEIKNKLNDLLQFLCLNGVCMVLV
ncbi:unnamed protein product, partial [Adineta ricciae]